MAETAATFDTREFARLTGAAYATVLQAIWDGRISARKVNGQWRIPKESLDAWRRPTEGEHIRVKNRYWLVIQADESGFAVVPAEDAS